jgi:hypothetical protein
MECPKCGQSVRDVATFCTRCHATLRFKCPACRNEQRHGGKCDKCGVDFLKYQGILLAQERVQHDEEHERLERRSSLLKNLIWLPITGGISFIRYFLKPKER